MLLLGGFSRKCKLAKVYPSLELLFGNKKFFSHMNSENRSSYEEAVYALNGLQSNAVVLQKAREERSANAHRNLTETKRHLETLGIKVGDVDSLNTIHISGTKGKGSTCAFTESILRHHGYKTGFYSSPHLITVNERIRINGQPVAKDLFAKYFWQVYNVLHGNLKEDEKMPSYFLFLTVMAFYVFKKEKVDVAVIEVGIGGLYDCTNFIQNPVVVGVTTLGLDHVSLLGDTIVKIAEQKAGIFKPNVPAYTVPQLGGALSVLQKQAQLIGCPLALSPPLEAYLQNHNSFNLGVPGAVQSLNASLALQLCKTWLDRTTANDVTTSKNELPALNVDNSGVLESSVPLATPFDLSSIFNKGLKACVWPGRFQTVKKNKFTFYLDGAHTFQSMKHCARWFEEASQKESEKLSGSGYRLLLFNCTGERKAESLLDPLSDLYFDMVLFSPNRKAVMQDSASDQSNFNVDPAKELEQCNINREIWCHLMRSFYENEVSVSSQVSANCFNVPKQKSKYCDPDNTLLFTCLNSAFGWLFDGMPCGQYLNGLYSVLEYNTLHESLKEASHIQVLVTGSLHLVGGVLSVIDPNLESVSAEDV